MSEQRLDALLHIAGLSKKSAYRPCEVARLLQCSTRTVYRLIEDGRLQSIRLRHGVRITYDAIIYYLDLFAE